MDVLRSGSERRFGAAEIGSLCTYSALVTWLVFRHQPWTDEAQAWLIARDSSLGEIFLRRLHYEGTPGLWHLVLWVMCRLHISYAGMHFLTAGIGILTVAFLLQFAPFPRWIRLTLPFIFGLVYQTAVTARSYSLVAVLVFIICALLTGRRDRPVTLALFVGLLANCALVAAVMSAGFVAFYVVRKMTPGPPQGAAAEQAPRQRISGSRLASAAGVLLVLWGAAIYTALPAPDAMFGTAATIRTHPVIARALGHLTGATVPTAPAVTGAALQLPANPAKVGSWQVRAWNWMRANDPPRHVRHLLLRATIFLSICFYVISSSNLVAASLYLVLLVWLYARSQLWAVLPLGFTLVTCYALGFMDHHAVLAQTALVGTLWLACGTRPQHKPPQWISRAFAAVIVLVIVEQIGWTASAVRLGLKQPFDGSSEAVALIQSQAQGKRIDGFAPGSSAVEPYFRHIVYSNAVNSYWPWRSAANPDEHAAEAIGLRPDYILLAAAFTGTAAPDNQILHVRPVGDEWNDPSLQRYILVHGYRQTHAFCGVQPAHFGYSVRVCDFIFEPAKPSPLLHLASPQHSDRQGNKSAAGGL
ncbi:MAG TPA: hypothetical protein VGS02_05385 [Acidobacteriaceae bacterium]|nr:hypothetical protein [Acidobacteriaceae bacterium]